MSYTFYLCMGLCIGTNLLQASSYATDSVELDYSDDEDKELTKLTTAHKRPYRATHQIIDGRKSRIKNCTTTPANVERFNDLTTRTQSCSLDYGKRHADESSENITPTTSPQKRTSYTISAVSAASPSTPAFSVGRSSSHLQVEQAPSPATAYSS